MQGIKLGTKSLPLRSVIRDVTRLPLGGLESRCKLLGRCRSSRSAESGRGTGLRLGISGKHIDTLRSHGFQRGRMRYRYFKNR
jgi:hypothetical protein